MRRTITNATLAAAVDELLVLPGSTRLFRYEREGALANLTSPTLNAYLSQALGGGFTAKDFRTWGGTLLAAVELERRGPAASATEEKRVLAAVMRKVGDEPGNTAAVARASYVSTAVVEHYRAGCTLADFRSANGAGSVGCRRRRWRSSRSWALRSPGRERFARRRSRVFRMRVPAPRRWTMISLLVLLLLILAIAGGIALSKFLFLLLVVALVVAFAGAFGRTT